MARIRLSKHELARQRKQLALYQKLLPSLDLKRRQLTVELAKAEAQFEATRFAVDELETRIGAALPMLAFREIDVRGMVELTAVELAEENVVGARLPVLDHIECAVADYSLLGKPAWVDVLVERLREAATERIRVQVAQERVRRLAMAVRRTTQRVNLFDKVLIPEAREAIRRIMIYMGDQERAAVVNAKLAKAKLKQQQTSLAAEES